MTPAAAAPASSSLFGRLLRGFFAGFGEASCAFHALPMEAEPATALSEGPSGSLQASIECVVLPFPLERRRAEVPLTRNLASAR